MDLGTGLALFGSAKLVGKLLGPTAAYLGDGLRDWTEMRFRNLAAIFESAAQRLGPKLEEDGMISSRVLQGLLTEGSFCDDPLTVDYFGGVLASSRSGVSRDDRGAVVVRQISNLSAYELRLHYMLYTELKRRFDGIRANPGRTQVRERLSIYFPLSAYKTGMDFTPEEDQLAILTQSLARLRKERLIDNYHQARSEMFQQMYPGRDIFEEYGFIMKPSIIGFALYLWAQGKGDTTHHKFFSKGLRLSELSGVIIPDNLFAMAPATELLWNASDSPKDEGLEEIFGDPKSSR